MLNTTPLLTLNFYVIFAELFKQQK